MTRNFFPKLEKNFSANIDSNVRICAMCRKTRSHNLASISAWERSSVIKKRARENVYPLSTGF